MRRFPLFLDDAPAGGGGAGTKAADPPATEPVRPRANSLVDQMVRRHGSMEAALSTLATQLVTAEDQNVTDLRTIKELRAKLPADGSVVLPPERAKAFNEFEAMKLTAAQVGEVVKERDTLKGAVHVHGVEKLARAGAPVIGFDPDATVDLVTSKALHIELREVEVEVDKGGKKEKVKQQVPFVRPSADDKAQLQSLAEYAKTLPAFEQRGLKATPPEKGTTTGAPAATTATYPEQGATRQGAEVSDGQAVLKQVVRDKYPTPSELRKSQQTQPQGA